MTDSTKQLTYTSADTYVMILAAGQGKRMLPLTKDTPKPLLKVGKHALIEHHLIRLQQLGFQHIVINIAYHPKQIKQALGDGKDYGLTIHYSDESNTGALETAGGIYNALPLIKSDPFLVINADIWTDFDFSKLLIPLESQGRLVLVPNPSHNPNGDFTINQNQQLELTDSIHQTMTFSGIALYHKALFNQLSSTHHALGPLLRQAIQKQTLTGLLYDGLWTDVGTPQRLKEVNQTHSKTA